MLKDHLTHSFASYTCNSYGAFFQKNQAFHDTF